MRRPPASGRRPRRQDYINRVNLRLSRVPGRQRGPGPGAPRRLPRGPARLGVGTMSAASVTSICTPSTSPGRRSMPWPSAPTAVTSRPGPVTTAVGPTSGRRVRRSRRAGRGDRPGSLRPSWTPRQHPRRGVQPRRPLDRRRPGDLGRVRTVAPWRSWSSAAGRGDRSPTHARSPSTLRGL